MQWISAAINKIFELAYNLESFAPGHWLLRCVLSTIQAFNGNLLLQCRCLDYMATLSSCLGRFDQAEGYHKQSLVMYRRVLDAEVDLVGLHGFVLACEDYASLLEHSDRVHDAVSILTTAAEQLGKHQLLDKAETLSERAQKLRLFHESRTHIQDDVL